MNGDSNSSINNAYSKRELLKKLLQEKTAQEKIANSERKPPVSPSTAEKPIQRVDRSQDSFPLSFAQRRMWVLDQLEPGNPAYNLSVCIRLRGHLRADALTESIAEVIRRHETLRTTFTMIEDEPVQVIHAPFTIPVPIVTIQPERESELSRLINEESSRPFDLLKIPLVRAKLLKLGDTDHVFIFTFHHIITDGWSLRVFIRELQTLYQAFVNKRTPLLPDLPVQYVDFAHWQEEWLQGDVLESQLSYWKKQLAAPLPMLNLPADYARPKVQTFHGAREVLAMSEYLSSALKELSRQEGSTLFMTLLAAFSVLLYRQTGQADMVIGTPIAGRSRSELEGLIGIFLNTLVMRIDLGNCPTFRELVQRVREVAMQAYANQDIPFEKLLEELHPERHLNRTPIFQVFFNMLNFGEGVFDFGDLKGEYVDRKDTEARFDLTVYVGEEHKRIHLVLVYNSDMFHREYITDLFAQYTQILEQVATNPDQSISALRLIPDAESEKRRIYIPNLEPYSSFVVSASETISSRFRSIVDRFPNNLAVKTDKYRLTYQDLYQASLQVAVKLQKSSIGQAQQVALLFEHDAPMVVAIFSALMAGKTYVPLDPSYPQQRLEFILHQSQAKYILTNGCNLSLAKTLAGDSIQLINIDEVSERQDKFVPEHIDPNELAYILYTSGSTGQPKGVMQNHHNVMLHIRNYTNNLRINSSDRLTLLSSYSFDAAVMAIYGALLNGAVLLPYDVNASGLSKLGAWMVQEGITIYHSTPTLYRYFMETLSPDVVFSQVRIVVLGGEEVIKNDFDLYKKYFPRSCYFVNGLGPTESTLALQNILTHDSLVQWGSVPVGYPVEGIEVLLLDEFGNPGALEGEIALSGSQLALGYWERPDLTNASFQRTSANSSHRIYRTGDLGRLLPDGKLMFLGRKDEQVKVRGFRIELSEIEMTLNRHPAVKQAVITARQGQDDDKCLVSYIVPTEMHFPNIYELKGYLQQYLPSYMIPAHFVLIDEVPLTPNGKVNKRALPEPDIQSARETIFVVPQTQLQESLAEIWRDVLHLEKVGTQDNFFELGGHSLMATRVISRIRDQYYIDLPLRLMFMSPTIAELAEAVDTILWATREPLNTLHAVPGNQDEFEL